jgi:UDP-N-acetylmuramoylalanine--D-glutamate ligase
MTSQRYVIVGLGATGLSCAQYLRARHIPFAVTDSRPNPPNLAVFQADFPDVEVVVGKLDAALLNEASTIVLSPGVAVHEPEIAEQIKRGIPVIGDIELFAQAVKVPVIAITGTNAKSTVTTLVGMMAKAAGYQVEVGGNLGVPALDLLASNSIADLFVLELSSFQLETTYSLKPQVATVLNITPDHMDRYQQLADYQQAKHRVYLHSQKVVCNRDDALTDTPSAHKICFTLKTPKKNEFGLITKSDGVYLAFEDQCLLAVKELPVIGKHYQANALAALAIGYSFGFPLAAMIKVLREFTGLPHRCQFVREYKQVKWYNDSKGTNVGATQAAIEGLGSEITGKLVLIAGGLGKGADFTSLVPTLEKYTRHVVLIGQAAPDLAKAIGSRVSISFAKTMDDAVQEAVLAAKPDDSVLLSPACASWDMYKNFEHRGQVFTGIVEQLGK